MKKFTLLSIFALTAICFLSSCGPKCAYYHAEIMGIKSPSQKYCDDQLKEVEKNPNMIKDEKKD